MFDAAVSAGIGAGDRVHIRTAGAYTTAYAARFNGFEIPDVRIAGYDARS
jgi:ornithine decarboxylase